jgi:hypothetical protein
MSDAEALKALGSFPIIQAAVALLIVFSGLAIAWYVARNGKKPADNGAPTAAVPQWLLMGPLHDAIGAVHDIAEQGRGTNIILDRIDKATVEMAKEQREQTMLLEDIRNNQIARSDIAMPPHPPRRKPNP